MIILKKDQNIFLYRVAGVAIHDEKLLIHRSILDDFWSLPGGRCEILEISKNAFHPYSIALISAVPSGDPTVKKRVVRLEGEVPSPIFPPPGCPFNTRCPYVKDICYEEFPELEGDPFKHAFACHNPQKLSE